MDKICEHDLELPVFVNASDSFVFSLLDGLERLIGTTNQRKKGYLQLVALGSPHSLMPWLVDCLNRPNVTIFVSVSVLDELMISQITLASHLQGNCLNRPNVTIFVSVCTG